MTITVALDLWESTPDKYAIETKGWSAVKDNVHIIFITFPYDYNYILYPYDNLLKTALTF